jgi:hypothetical protein
MAMSADAPVTSRLAVLLGSPAGVSAVATPLVVLGLLPAFVLVTVAVIVQVPFAGTFPAVTLKLVPPATALLATPVHDPPTVLEESVMFTSVSVKLRPVSGRAFGFVRVKVIVDVPPDTIGLGAKAFEIEGGLMARIAIWAAAEGPVPADELADPESLMRIPGVPLVTLTVTAQPLEAETDPPDRATELPSPAAFGVPPHVFVRPGLVALKRPVG